MALLQLHLHMHMCRLNRKFPKIMQILGSLCYFRDYASVIGAGLAGGLKSTTAT